MARNHQENHRIGSSVWWGFVIYIMLLIHMWTIKGVVRDLHDICLAVQAVECDGVYREQVLP